MKKIITILLIVFITFIFTACNNEKNFNTVEWTANPANPASPVHVMLP